MTPQCFCSRSLFGLLADAGADVERFRPLADLRIYAVQLRYSFVEPLEPTLDRESTCAQVKVLCDHVEALLAGATG